METDHLPDGEAFHILMGPFCGIQELYDRFHVRTEES